MSLRLHPKIRFSALLRANAPGAISLYQQGESANVESVPIASSSVKTRSGERLTFSSEPVLRTLVSFFSRTGLT